MTEPQGTRQRSLKRQLRFLYEAEHPTAHRFRYALLMFDIATILFIVATSFAERTPLLEAVDVMFGLGILADFAARLFSVHVALRSCME